MAHSSTWTGLTPFVGRRREVAAIRDTLARGRLTTLTGAGGVGKTRLAMEVARLTAPQLDGRAWLIRLEGITDAAGVERAIAAGIGLRLPQLSHRDAIARALGDRASLIVLDECETALHTVADVVGALLRASVEVRFLATSRRALEVTGEAVYVVPPMAIADDDLVDPRRSQGDAVSLLAQCLRAHGSPIRLDAHGLALAREVCRRLDGLPLGIEIASAQGRHLGLVELLERLRERPPTHLRGRRDAPSRQRSLAATVDWSLGLVDQSATAVFRALALFRDGFDLDAARATTGAASRTDGHVALLVDHSLLVRVDAPQERARFRMLEPIRERALELLREARETDSVAARHAAYFAALAGRLDRSLRTLEESTLLARCEVDDANLNVALEWQLAHAPAAAAEMAGRLAPYWLRRGRIAEGRDRLERCLAATPPGIRLDRVRLGLAGVLEVQGEFAAALDQARAALLEAERSGDAEAAALAHLLIARMVAPDLEAARRAFDAASRSAESAGEPVRCLVLGEYASIEWALGDPLRAIAFATESLHAARLIGNAALIVPPATVLARRALFSRHLAADALWRECLERARETGDPVLIQGCLAFTAMAAVRRGDVAASLVPLRDAVGIARRLDSRPVELQLSEVIGIVLIDAGVPLEGLTLVLAKERLAGPDWIDSPAWWRYVVSEVEAAALALGAAADAARRAALELGAERLFSVAVAGLDRLEARLPRRSRQTGTQLSRREAEVASLVGSGLTNREIAARAGISERTVDAHLRHIMDKLGASNRTQVAAWVLRERPAAPEVA